MVQESGVIRGNSCHVQAGYVRVESVAWDTYITNVRLRDDTVEGSSGTAA